MEGNIPFKVDTSYRAKRYVKKFPFDFHKAGSKRMSFFLCHVDPLSLNTDTRSLFHDNILDSNRIISCWRISIESGYEDSL